MYGWSNDLFFAPSNPGIAVYDQNGSNMKKAKYKYDIYYIYNTCTINIRLYGKE